MKDSIRVISDKLPLSLLLLLGKYGGLLKPYESHVSLLPTHLLISLTHQVLYCSWVLPPRIIPAE